MRGVAQPSEEEIAELEAANEALRLDPSIVDAYYQRGLAYKNKGDLNAAIADFKKVLELDNDSLRAEAEAQLQELGAP